MCGARSWSIIGAVVRGLIMMSLMVGVPAARAANLPGNIDPGAQRERTQRDLLEQQRAREEDRAPPGEAIEGPSGPEGGNLPESDQVFVLEGIEFPESYFLEADVLRRIAEDYIGVEIVFDDLNAMLTRINALYRERGIITGAAYIPPQTVADGVLKVALIEGRLGRYSIRGADDLSVPTLRGWLPISEGQVIDVPQLRDVINQINREMSINLRASIQPGEETGESDVVIEVQEPPRFTISTFVDNHGSESTGEWRAGAIGVMNNPFGRADRITVYALGADGSVNGLLSYRSPVNRYGGSIELSLSSGSIEIVDGPFRDLDVEGESNEAALRIRQPFLSGSYGSVAVRGEISESESETTVAGTTVSDFNIRETELGMEWSGQGERSFWRGSQSLNRASVEALDSGTEEFDRYPGYLSCVYLISASWTVRGRLDWQIADEADLPSSLVYQLGGPATVRGYEQGVVSGGRGYHVSASADYRWSERLRQSLFVDYGEVDQGASGTESLYSAGTSVTWSWTDDVRIEGAVGVPLREVTPDQDSVRAHVRANMDFEF